MSPSRFARRSFLRGMAHTLDMGGTLRMPGVVERRGDISDDARALARDWGMIGGDFGRAVEAIERDTRSGHGAKQ